MTTPQTIRLELAYENGYHRYIPKLSTDRIHWTALDTTEFVHDREAGTALLTLDVTPEPIYVSAQEHITSEDVYAWADSLTTLPFVEQSVIGQSHRGRDLIKLVVNATGNPDAPVIVVMGRQHPPEIPGAMAMETFCEYLYQRRARSHGVSLALPDDCVSVDQSGRGRRRTLAP